MSLMKTQIIILESHDDLISVRDRMSWAKTPRILLVWPKFEKVTLRQVDLKVLQRHALSLGAQLGLVTRTRRVRAAAEALGMPVFESTGQAQRKAWPAARVRRWPRRPPRKDLRARLHEARSGAGAAAWRESPGVRAGSFVIGVLSVLVLVALFIPRAQVSLQPMSKTQSVVLPVTASPSVDSVFITGTIPAREVRTLVEGRHSITVTGEGIVPQAKARGVAVFRNLTQEDVTIPAETVIHSGGDERVRFITLEEGMVEAGVGETLELPIEAVEGGLAGNLEADAINAIEGRLGLLLAVSNPDALTGGRELASVQAGESDRERVKNLLLESLEGQALEQLAAELIEDDMLFEDTFQVSQIISEIYDPPPGAVGLTLSVSMQVEYSAQYASAADLAELAALALNASVPVGFTAGAGSLSVEPITVPVSLENGGARWTVRAEREIVQHINAAYAAQLIQGVSAARAEARLEENLPLSASPEVALSPSWWPWVPIVPFRISVLTR